jgi:hypothetical protein
MALQSDLMKGKESTCVHNRSGFILLQLRPVLSVLLLEGRELAFFFLAARFVFIVSGLSW